MFLDQWGTVFAHVMTQAFQDKIAKECFAALHTLFHGLGRLINLFDAMADVHADHAAGRFNPILRAEPDLNLTRENSLQDSYNKYLEKIRSERNALMSLLPALDLRDSYPVVHNILTYSLDREARKVHDAMVLHQPVSEKMFFNCKEF
jgi:hypothetical protein